MAVEEQSSIKARPDSGFLKKGVGSLIPLGIAIVLGLFFFARGQAPISPELATKPTNSYVSKVEVDGVTYVDYETLSGYTVRIPQSYVVIFGLDDETRKVNYIRIQGYWNGEIIEPFDKAKHGGPQLDKPPNERTSRHHIQARMHFQKPGSIPQTENFFLSRAEQQRRRIAETGSKPLGKGEAFPFPEYNLIAHTSLHSKKTDVYDWFELVGVKDPMGAVIDFGCGMKRDRFIRQDFAYVLSINDEWTPNFFSCRAGYHLAPDSWASIDMEAGHLKNGLQIFTALNALVTSFLVEE